MPQDKYPSIPLTSKPEDYEKARLYDERKINIGNYNITLEKVALPDVTPDSIYTFAYRAKRPGTNGRGWNLPIDAYDATPLILPLSIDRKYILGLNTHYLTLLPDKTKFVYKWRKGLEFNEAMIKLMIHKYRLDRISSPLFLCKDVTVDYKVISTSARWTRVKAK